MSDRLERDYVLGTHDTEVTRLGLQHRAWREVAAGCWKRAGIRRGQRVIDLGAGPGYAAFDLAQLVGEQGSVVAVERSTRFVEAGMDEARRRGLSNVTFRESDLVHDPLPEGPFDAAWCRWVCSFVSSPADLISKLPAVMHPGAILVFHEYVDYASWRFSPHLPLMDEYVRRVMESWRSAGGEPDVAMSLPPLLQQNGFAVRETVPRMFCVSPGDPLWTWISTFVMSNLARLEKCGDADPSWTQAVRTEFLQAEADPGTLMLTPAVLEIIAELPV